MDGKTIMFVGVSCGAAVSRCVGTIKDHIITYATLNFPGLLGQPIKI